MPSDVGPLDRHLLGCLFSLAVYACRDFLTFSSEMLPYVQDSSGQIESVKGSKFDDQRRRCHVPRFRSDIFTHKAN